jgi:hypothetical protein
VLGRDDLFRAALVRDVRVCIAYITRREQTEIRGNRQAGTAIPSAPLPPSECPQKGGFVATALLPRAVGLVI